LAQYHDFFTLFAISVPGIWTFTVGKSLEKSLQEILKGGTLHFSQKEEAVCEE